MTADYIWWKDAIVYQIWPASYKDSNGDGIGDLRGIISTLDYLKDLGITVIWLSPMYDSPQDDMGYDISNYESIYPKYGTMEDMNKLIEEVHKRGIKLVLDLVINHTSSEHEWFKESRSSKSNPKRDWYIWKPPRILEDGTRLPPNNWGSHFSGSAWEYDELTGEYYLRLFAKTQPDLNWENEETRKAIYKSALTFWFEKGIDGFRIDTAGLYSKDQRFLDAPIVFPDNDYQPCGKWCHNGPRIHEFHKEMFAKVTSKYDAMTVGEVGDASRETALKYVGAKEKEMNMMFLFDVVDVGSVKFDKFKYDGYTLKEFKKAVESQSNFLEGTDAWSTVFIENHDQPRCVSRFGNPSPKYLEKSAKLLAILQTTLTGTLFIYQGQEIGMTNVPKDWSIDEYKDINTINYYNEFKEKHSTDPDFNEKEKKLLENINLLARDNARSPIQWNASENAGFTTGKPWMRINNNYKEINVESQIGNPESVLSFWKDSIDIRKKYRDTLIYGTFQILDIEDEKLFTYLKCHNNSKAYIVLNFSPDSVKFKKLLDSDFKLVHSNNNFITEDNLAPYEGRVYIVDP